MVCSLFPAKGDERSGIKHFSSKYFHPNKRQKLKHRDPVKHFAAIHNERRGKHAHNLKTFAATLKSLGVNVDEHLQKLNAEDEYLQQAEEEMQGAAFLTPADKRKLAKALNKLFYASNHILILEREIWGKIRPTVSYAMSHAFLENPLPIDTAVIGLVSEKHGKKRKKGLEKAIPKLRGLLNHSFKQEKELLFVKYPVMLEFAESASEDLIEIERGLGSRSKARHKFSELNFQMRSMLHEDILELAQDIDKLYGLRIMLVEHMMEAAEKAEVGDLEQLKKDLDTLKALQKHYRLFKRKHIKKLNELDKKFGGGTE
jgi:hypothetical protein